MAEPAEGADDLVGDQQHVVLVADLADPLEVAGRGREAAAGVLHRLEEDRGDGVGALELDRLGDAVGRPLAELVLVVLGPGLELLGRAVEVRVRHPERRRHQRLERRLHARQAGDRQRALRRAVVGDGAADHLVLGRLAGELEVLLGQLPGRLDGLAATGGEEDAVQVARRVARDPLGEVDGARVGVGPEREERQLGGLLRCGLGELGAAVPEPVRRTGRPARRCTCCRARPRCAPRRRARSSAPRGCRTCECRVKCIQRWSLAARWRASSSRLSVIVGAPRGQGREAQVCNDEPRSGKRFGGQIRGRLMESLVECGARPTESVV